MTKEKIKISRIDINHKFYDFEQAEKHTKKLKPFIKYLFKSKKFKLELLLDKKTIYQ